MSNEHVRITIEDYFRYGIDIRNRRIYFGDIDSGEVGNEMQYATVQIAIRGIDKLVSISNKPIELHFSSFGGCPYNMLALYDKIQETPCKFVFYGRGMIQSAATWIMVGCDERYLSKNTTVMLHDGSFGTEGKHTDVQIAVEEDKNLQDRLNQIFVDNSFMPRPFWEAVLQRDLYIYPEEALVLGMIDGIVVPAKRGNFRKVRGATFDREPDKKSMKALLRAIGERIKRPDLRVVKVNTPRDEFGEYPEYDNTDQELGIKKTEEKK